MITPVPKTYIDVNIISKAIMTLFLDLDFFTQVSTYYDFFRLVESDCDDKPKSFKFSS